MSLNRAKAAVSRLVKRSLAINGEISDSTSIYKTYINNSEITFPMKTGYLVCDVMTQKPISVESGTPVSECAKIMAKYHVGSLVVTKANKILGLLTEKDIVRKIVAESIEPSKVHAGEISQTKFPSISPEKDVYEAILLMRDKNVRHLPVMNKNSMVGFLTGKDILKVQPQLFELLADKIELREQGRKLSAVR